MRGRYFVSHFLLIIAFALSINVANASGIIKGVVLSKESSEPIAFATVALEGTHYGVVTNDEVIRHQSPKWRV